MTLSHYLQVPEPASLNTLGLQTSVIAFSQFISKVLEVNSTNIDITDFSLVPGGKLTSGSSPADMQVQFSVSPADSYSVQHVSTFQKHAEERWGLYEKTAMFEEI